MQESNSLGFGVLVSGQSSVSVQVLVLLPLLLQLLQSLQIQVSAVHEGVQVCSSAGLGLAARSQSNVRVQVLVCFPSTAQIPQSPQTQTSSVHVEPPPPPLPPPALYTGSVSNELRKTRVDVRISDLCFIKNSKSEYQNPK